MARQRRHHGSVRQLPSGRWQARYRDPLTGKRLTAPGTFRTRGEGSKWLALLESGALDASKVPASKADLRLGGYASEWIATRNLRPRTRQLYELQFRLHVGPVLGDARLAKLEARHVRAWHADLSGGELSRVTVAKVYRLLRSILATAVDDGLLAENPCRIKGAGIERSVERMIPGLEDVAKLAEFLPDHLALVPWMGALAGLRKGDLFGLARRHIDLDMGTVRVERALQEIPGAGAVMVEPKSHAGYRLVTMPARLVCLVDSHLQVHVDDHPTPFCSRTARVVPSGRRSGLRHGTRPGELPVSKESGSTICAISPAPSLPKPAPPPGS
jgi:integrase